MDRHRRAPRPLAPTATIPKASASARTSNRNNRAVKVWDKREYKNLDDTVELGTRNIKVALRRLRKFAREGAPDELDLDGTIKRTANNGAISISMLPGAAQHGEGAAVLRCRRLDGLPHQDLRGAVLGGARRIQAHGVLLLPQLPLRERVEGQRRRHAERMPTWDVLHTYPADYKVIFVGDATMSPYEITFPAAPSSIGTRSRAACGLQR